MPTSAQVLVLFDDGHLRLKEIGQMLGVTLQRAQQLAAQPDFPEPSRTVGRSRLWRRDEVETWARRSYWSRKPWYPRMQRRVG
jgi:predicted DNA-binding transcriptional regulator AlpA